MKTIAVIPAGKFQIPFIKFLRERGFRVVSIDESNIAPGHSYSDINITEKLENVSKVIKKLEDSRIKLDGVISYCSDVGMVLSAQLSDYFEIRINQIDSALKLTRKDLQRQRWKESKIATPNFVLATEMNLDRLDIPVIFVGQKIVIKPVDLAGSNGVFIVDAGSSSVSRYIQNAIQLSKVGIAIIEEYMTGEEYTVDGFMVSAQARVLLMTRKHKEIDGLPTVANMLEAIDNRGERVSKAQDFVEKSLLALGYSDGPFHCELIINQNEVVGMIEAAGRGGGSNLANRMVEIHSGQNYFELSLSHAIGTVIKKQFHKNQPCLMYFFPSKSGTFHSFQIPEKFLSLELRKRLTYNLYMERGEVMQNASNDGGRIGDLIIEIDSYNGYRSLTEQLNFDEWVTLEN